MTIKFRKKVSAIKRWGGIRVAWNTTDQGAYTHRGRQAMEETRSPLMGQEVGGHRWGVKQPGARDDRSWITRDNNKRLEAMG